MNRLLKFALPGVVGVLLLAAFFLLFLREKPTAVGVPIPPEAAAFLNLAPAVKYVGDEECAVCHSEIYRTFKQTGMGRSFYRPTPENVIEDYARNNEVYDPRSRLRYQMYRRDNDFFQLEYRLNENGEVIHGHGRKVDYVIGSGNSTRSYITSENGFLFEMPATWYSEKKLWDLSPGYHTRNLRFSRPIVQECMNCHNSYADYVEHSENRYAETPLGIGCERCHGPGALHAAKRSSAKAGAALNGQLDSTIVNPGHLPVGLQIDVCRQCHLQGDMAVLKEGRKDTDFRPGMRLRDIKAVFIRDQLEAGDFRIASHGARISLSACFTQSGGRLTCTFCHNPHQPVKTLSRAFFNGKCLECHSLAKLTHTNGKIDHRDGSDCVACHMRQGATADVLHVNFTDHWIQKEIQTLSPSETDSLLRPDDAHPVVLRDFFAEQDPAATGLQLGIAYVRYFEAKHGAPEYLRRALPLLETGLRENPDHQNGLYHLGLAYLHLRRPAEAQAQLQKLIALSPEHALAHFQLGEALQQLGRLEEAATAYRNSLKIFPDNAKASNNLGNVYATLGKLDDAVAAYQQALQIQPSYAAAYNNLGDLYFYRQGDAKTARKYFEKALRLEPNFVTAMHHLGNLHLKTGNEEAAQKLYQQILTVDPRFAAAYGNLAVIYQRRGQREQAILCLRQVLDIDPGDARAKDMLRQLASGR